MYVEKGFELQFDLKHNAWSTYNIKENKCEFCKESRTQPYRSGPLDSKPYPTTSRSPCPISTCMCRTVFMKNTVSYCFVSLCSNYWLRI